MNSRQCSTRLLVVAVCLLSACSHTPTAAADYIGYARTDLPAVRNARTLVFVEIRESIMPLERGHKYEDPLDDALKKAHLGEVTGGGTALSKNHVIEWVGIDVELTDLDKGMPFLKQKLIELGVPADTVLEYEVEKQRFTVPVQDH